MLGYRCDPLQQAKMTRADASAQRQEKNLAAQLEHASLQQIAARVGVAPLPTAGEECAAVAI